MEPKEVEVRKAKEIIARYDGKRSSLIAMLQDIQEVYKYLPREVLSFLSTELAVPLSQIYEVATFYKAFSLKPKGEHIVKLCLGTACHVRGAPRILEKLERELKIKVNETSEDYRYSLETVNCVGACALGPIVIVDGEYHGQMNLSKVEKVIESLKKGA